MTKEKPTITPAERLQLFAMISLAASHYVECRRIEAACLTAFDLGSEPGDRNLPDHLADVLYRAADERPITLESLDEALARSEIEVSEDQLAENARQLADNLEAADEAKTDPIYADAAGMIRALVEDRRSGRSKL